MFKVSIIVPFYNCPYIGQALESLINQTYASMEIIVVDDGSTQYTELIEPYLFRIRYIRKKNGGTASALNMGIKNLTGEYFAWLSADDLFYPTKLEKQIEFMQTNEAKISYCSAININPNKIQLNPPTGSEYPDKLHFLKDLSKKCTINGCTVMAKMEVFDEIGLFDESLLYTHDYDLWLRAVQKYEFYFLNEPLVLYRVHKEMSSIKFKSQIVKEVQKIRKKYERILNELIRIEQKRNNH
jgi:glycosyltransferase involved in cell wall biosynthesis